MNTIWHKRGEKPQDYKDSNELFVYEFDDGVDVTEYHEQYFECSNLKRWCRYSRLISMENRNKQILLQLDNVYKENEELKALLKECEPFIRKEKETYVQAGFWDAGMYIEKLNNLLTRISEKIRCD